MFINTPTKRPGALGSLADNGVIVHDGTVSAIRSLLINGRDGGAWDGTTGIASSAAAARDLQDESEDYAVGYSTGSSGPIFGHSTVSSDVAVHFARAGDVNLSGMVTIADRNIINANMNDTGMAWYQGDLNYDGTVDSTDFDAEENARGSGPLPTLSATPVTVPTPTAVSVPAASAVRTSFYYSSQWQVLEERQGGYTIQQTVFSRTGQFGKRDAAGRRVRWARRSERFGAGVGGGDGRGQEGRLGGGVGLPGGRGKKACHALFRGKGMAGDRGENRGKRWRDQE